MLARFAAAAAQPWVTLTLALACVSCSESASEPQCPDFRTEKNLYFGDLHAHTALSYDAHLMGTRTGHQEAYDFAKGGTMRLAPYEPDGGREVQLSRPLDFVSLPEHSEYLGEVQFCTTPGNPAYDTELCSVFRESLVFTILDWASHNDSVPFGAQPMRWEAICEQPGVDCVAKATEVWQGVVQDAEAATVACSFSAFPGYEYTRAPSAANTHRNIIFRDSNVIPTPLSGYEIPNPNGLYTALQDNCIDADIDCDVIAIPHNSNWSNGRMFTPDFPDGIMTLEEQARLSELRASLEPIAEIYQVKGWMECKNGFAGIPDDPLCADEKTRNADAPICGQMPGVGGVNDEGCTSRYDFIRNVFKLGLSEERRIGVNPYKLGVLGSTDTHSGNPGQAAEYNFAGSTGKNDADPAVRVAALFQDVPAKFNPGGLTAVWAEQNTRNAIFDAMKRKEIYATTGTRLSVRFFGGWEYEPAICDGGEFARAGYDGGVPMGGDLPGRPSDATAPRFAVLAVKDDGSDSHPGPLLQRVQVIKGWVDEAGVERETIYEVAGNPSNGATVDASTCQMNGPGDERLCTVWSDPDFDPDVAAFYYARVVENPACSWRQYDCNGLPEERRPPSCSEPRWYKPVQDRATTSPIWYDP